MSPLRTEQRYFTRDARRIAACAEEIRRQAGFYQRNGHGDEIRFLLIDTQVITLGRLTDRAARRYEKAREALSAYLYFPGSDFADQAQTYGDDPYPIGLKAMRKTLERAMQGSLEQGLIRKPINVDEIYHPSLRGT